MGRTSPLAYDPEVERSARSRRNAVRQFSTNLDFTGLEELFTKMPGDDDTTGVESPPRGVDSYYRPGTLRIPCRLGHEEPYAHLREIFSIADTYQVNNTTKDGSEMQYAFLDEFYSISKTAAIRNKIKSFRQIPGE
ncbi:hypothetical protein Tco_1391636 [Tanacetum coccineum]